MYVINFEIVDRFIVIKLFIIDIYNYFWYGYGIKKNVPHANTSCRVEDFSRNLGHALIEVMLVR